jgi:aspartate kinase
MSQAHPIVVQKYGGSSVADGDKLREVASLIQSRREAGARVCVVVSAMGNTTDALLAQAKAMHKNPSRRELDMLLSCGERASMALLSMALDNLGVPSISFTGSQSGIITNDVHSGARILEVRPYRVADELEKGRVVIVAGFQGVSYKKEITTLGRGGSDTTAVALAAALGAESCEIYSDVEGVLSADPKVVPNARRLDALTHGEMQELAATGARVLNAQAVQFAREKGIALFARRTGQPDVQTVIRRDAPPPENGVRAISHRECVEVVAVPDVSNLPDVLEALSQAHLIPTEIIGDAAGTLLIFDSEDAHGLQAAAAALAEKIHALPDRGQVSLVGEGLGGQGSVIPRALAALAKAGLVPMAIQASTLRVSLFLPADQAQRGARALHAEFLEGE